MKEHMHLDEFIIDIKVDNKYQTLIVLCSLPGFYDHFINLILYGKYTISLVDFKSALKFMELRTRLNGKDSDDQAEGLFVKGCLDNSSNSRGRFSESRERLPLIKKSIAIQFIWWV